MRRGGNAADPGRTTRGHAEDQQGDGIAPARGGEAPRPHEAQGLYEKALKLKPDMKGLQEKIDTLRVRLGGKK